MAVNLGSTPISNIYIGNTQIQNVYLGNSLIYSAINSFNFTINTANTSTGSSAANQYKLPLTSTFNGITANVDWGDGATDVITAFNQAAVTHTYSSSGTYSIKISGALRGHRFANGGDRLKILNISNWGVLEINENGNFWGCSNMACNASDLPFISSLDLNLTFGSCSLFNGNLSNLNISVVTSLQNMFSAATVYDRSFQNWDINQVTNFNNFLGNTTLSTVNYDATLISWNNQAPITGRTISFGNAKYTLGGAAASARASLISFYGWTITDGGGI